MLQEYRRDGAKYAVSDEERIVFEGIYIASSISTGEVIIKMVEESVCRNDDYDTRKLQNIYTSDFVHLGLDNVAWV